MQLFRFALVSLAVLLAAQQPASMPLQQNGQSQAANQPTKPEQRCTIEGQVINALTGEPVRKAEITLRGNQRGPLKTTAYRAKRHASMVGRDRRKLYSSARTHFTTTGKVPKVKKARVYFGVSYGLRVLSRVRFFRHAVC
jgi:hypothetical protein